MLPFFNLNVCAGPPLLSGIAGCLGNANCYIDRLLTVSVLRVSDHVLPMLKSLLKSDVTIPDDNTCRPRISHQYKIPTSKIDQSENCGHEMSLLLH